MFMIRNGKSKSVKLYQLLQLLEPHKPHLLKLLMPLSHKVSLR